MSEENVEIVKRAIAAYGPRDYETMRELSHPDIELDWSASRGLEARVYQGRERVLSFYERYLDTFEEIDIQPDRFIESDDWVVVPNTGLVRGRDGIQTIARSALAFEVHGGLITRIRLYQETQEALEALGLSEEAVSEENVETARRWLEALSGGSEDFDRALTLVHRDIVFVPPGDQPPYRGAERLRRWMEPDAFEEQRLQAFEAVVVTGRTILGRQRLTARGTASGIELDVITWSVWKFDEDGLITRIEIYRDHEEDEAREAAGLSE